MLYEQVPKQVTNYIKPTKVSFSEIWTKNNF